MSHPLRRHAARPAAALLLALALALSACTAGSSSTKDVAVDFLSRLAAGDVDGAASLTDAPDATRPQLAQVREDIGTTRVEASVEGGAAGTARTTTLRWTVPAGATVETHGTLTVGDGDKVRYTPAVLDSRLGSAGRIVYSDELRLDTPVLDRTGRPLMTWATVTRVVLARDAASSAGAVAAALRPAAPQVTARSIDAGRGANPGSDYTVIALRAADLALVEAALAGIPGVTLQPEGRLITATPGMRSPVLANLPDQWRDRLRGDAGWALTAVDGQNRTALGGAPPRAAAPFSTTLDVAMQEAAQRAVDSRPEATSLVAISASTGGILAVAQNRAADNEGPVALTGQFPPGSTFKTVTTAAALEAGVTSPDAVLPCPGRVTVDGRTIPNDDDFQLGEVPLHTAFARSCNTTQALLSSRLAPDAMQQTAARLGLGADYAIPGLTTITGSVPVTEPGPARVEAAIGQGTVTASPFGLAVMEASLAAGGRAIHPSLLTGRSAAPNPAGPGISRATVEALRTMMRETVTGGTATKLRDIADLGGKTGTAEVASGPAHGWFAGIRGDIAFAVLVERGNSSGPAVDVAGVFLRDPAAR